MIPPAVVSRIVWVPIIRSDTVCRLRVSDGVWVARIAARDRSSGKDSMARDSRGERSRLGRGLRCQLVFVDEPAE